MASKKIPISASPGDEALEKRVEAIMGDAETVKIDVSKYQPAAKIVPHTAKPVVEATEPAPEVPTLSAPELPKASARKIAISSDENPETLPEPVKAAEPVSKPKAISITVEDDVEDKAEPIEATVIHETPELPAAQPEQPRPVTVEQAVLKHEEKVQKTGTTPLDDEATAAAIDEIAAQDSDVVLKKEDEVRAEKEPKPAKIKKAKGPRSKRKIFAIFVLLVLIALGALIAVPSTRYKVVGLAVKRTVAIKVIDAETKQPVSAAIVTINGQQATTSGEGIASVKSQPGPQTLAVSKEYYAAASQAATVPIMGGDTSLDIAVKATGRRVPVKIVNTLTGKPVAGAEIKVKNTSAKTDKSGVTTIVLPTDAAKQSASISSKNYNDKKVTVEVTASVVPANTFAIVPAGKVYTLSNANGTIDVIKMNLDGSAKTTVVKGTGKEDQATTVLLASRDWRYVALKSQRDKPQASMYMIDTQTDKLTEFDSGDASFTPIGWYEHTFMYDVVRNTVSTAQNGHEVIKSYDAERGQLNQLDQTQVSNVNNGNYNYQTFYNFYILENQLVYNTQWFSSGTASLSGKSNSIRGVQPNGQNKKDYLTLGAEGMAYIQSALTGPAKIYYASYNTSDNKTIYLEFENSTAKISNDVSQSDFNRNYPTYLVSPGGKNVLWSEQRNGRANPMIGDQDAGNVRQLSNLVGYTAYGWFTDDYLLLTKNSSELYIVSVEQAKSPVKITDYFKPERGIPGYGYGYGGL